jgi:DNA-binding HxlR family transcriptional regulator
LENLFNQVLFEVTMDGKTYGQYCGVAAALDVLGERWMLLVVRELLLGPARYSDLKARLGGIGTDLLAARLRRLEDEGLATRVAVPPPGAGEAYELTDAGRTLAPVVRALSRWGRTRLPDRRATGWRFDLGWGLLSACSDAGPFAFRATVGLRAGADAYVVTMDDGTCSVTRGSPSGADVEFVADDARPLLGLLTGAIALGDAPAAGITVTGPRRTVRQVLNVLRFEPDLARPR